MGQVVSEITHKDSYVTDMVHNLEQSEQTFNSSLKFHVYKNRNKQLVLDMSHKELRRIFMKKYSKKKVNILKLNDNYLRTLSYHLACMVNLNEIHLQHNNFRYFPVQLCSLIKLEILDLSLNHLDSLPYSVGNLVSLVKLDVSYNNISSVPESIRLLRNLSELNLSHNNFLALPNTLFSLSNLKSLNLSYNKLSYLPKDLVKLKSLEELNILGNTVTKVHASLKDYLLNLKGFRMTSPLKKESANNKDVCDGPNGRYVIIRNMLYPEKDATFRKLPTIPQKESSPKPQELDNQSKSDLETNLFEGYIFFTDQESSSKANSP